MKTLKASYDLSPLVDAEKQVDVRIPQLFTVVGQCSMAWVDLKMESFPRPAQNNRLGRGGGEGELASSKLIPEPRSF